MKHKHLENDKHDHNHGGVFGENTELYFAILSGVFFFTGLILTKFTNVFDWVVLTSFILSYFFGGYYTILEAFGKIKEGEFEIDFLMIVAAIGAAYIGSWQEGALLLFLFSIGHALEHYAMNKAKKSIHALGDLSPKTALVKKGNKIVEVAVEELQLNDIIVIKPNAKISADGVIIKGSSSINQASITGESMPVDKMAYSNPENLPEFKDIHKNNVVFTGTINGDSNIEVQVLKLSKDSTISRVIKMVSEVETKKSPTQLLTKKFEKWFVPAVIVLVVTLCFAYLVIDETVKESLYRAISVLVSASPCALAISTPSAVLSAIARAAKGGVLIKGGRALEDLGSLTTIAFDKTGTLTEGKPKLTNVVLLSEFNKNEFLSLVLEVENLSNHPLAKAIVKDIKKQFSIEQKNLASDIKAIQGKGLKAIYRGEEVYIGNKELMVDQKISISVKAETKLEELLKNGHTVMLVSFKKQLIGLLSVMDVPRESAKNTLSRLKRIGIKKMIMLTGDHQSVGDSIAKQIGLTEVRGNLLPENKVAAIEELKQRYSKIAMVGDGVNDAPAMANSTVGIAMGAAGSDVALETADVALMSDEIENLPFVIGLSRKSKSIIKQNLWISLGIVAFLIPTTLLGIANIGIAVAIHEGSTLIVVINALRLLKYNE
ncbi:heavy metal translocating P-type ATPase [Aquimarina muelleri]|uniref:P-type Zn(2+) transporter n=1 Tax=Aquimarina muelleri TaxID=279356 RepID=A0A918JX34_9FLAO|nr:heavy metal translocating P-type ATPase [Aquimarina muelleri]MCX2764106.1 heavy metal translocating P-type ATPase [Aquimarina muelleri]GGX22675.1 cation-transporting ATPase [Aquimarina muelleri]